MVGKARGFETVRDMVLSMAVVGAVVAALFLVVVWQRPEVQGAVERSVDVQGVFNEVKVSRPFEVLTPERVLPSWSPTSAWFDESAQSAGLDGSLLHAGFETASGSYATIEQTNASGSAAIAALTDSGRRTGSVEVVSRTWQTWESAADTKSLVLRLSREGTLVVVTGKADWPELEQLAGTLA